ncbi:MAG: hypothetical protein WAO83_09020 [Fuerstiella sp.]
MSLHLVMEPTAEADIQVIYDYIYEREPEGAIRWYLAFQTAANRALQLPESYPLAPENSSFETEVRNFLFKTRRGLIYRGLFIIRDQRLRSWTRSTSTQEKRPESRWMTAGFRSLGSAQPLSMQPVAKS